MKYGASALAFFADALQVLKKHKKNVSGGITQ